MKLKDNWKEIAKENGDYRALNERYFGLEKATILGLEEIGIVLSRDNTETKMMLEEHPEARFYIPNKWIDL